MLRLENVMWFFFMALRGFLNADVLRLEILCAAGKE
jgi:hypothetical protein